MYEYTCYEFICERSLGRDKMLSLFFVKFKYEYILLLQHNLFSDRAIIHLYNLLWCLRCFWTNKVIILQVFLCQKHFYGRWYPFTVEIRLPIFMLRSYMCTRISFMLWWLSPLEKQSLFQYRDFLEHKF